MPSFGRNSTSRLNSCHSDIIWLFREVVLHLDVKIISGHRGPEEQEIAFNKGFSKLAWPQSKHNSLPARAIDVCPVNWDFSNPDFHRLMYMGGYVVAIAKTLNIPVRWGGDWNQNHIFTDQLFNDLYHFELLDPPHNGDNHAA